MTRLERGDLEAIFDDDHDNLQKRVERGDWSETSALLRDEDQKAGCKRGMDSSSPDVRYDVMNVEKAFGAFESRSVQAIGAGGRAFELADGELGVLEGGGAASDPAVSGVR